MYSINKLNDFYIWSDDLKKPFKTLWAFLRMGFNCPKAVESLPGDSLLFTTKSLGVLGTHLIDFGRMSFVIWGPWIDNLAPEPLGHNPWVVDLGHS